MGRWLVLVVIAASCDREFNPEFCLGHPADPRCPIDAAGPPCSTAADCPGEICDLTTDTPHCAECSATDLSLCTATAPTCSTGGKCQGCVADTDCAAGVCLPDGSCPAEADIIYASIAGVMTAGCGDPATPCAIVQAITEVTSTRKIIKLIPDAAQDYTVTGGGGLTVNKDVTIAMRGARIRKTSSGSAVTIGAGNNVTFLGGAITGGMGSGHGIECATGVVTAIGTDIGGNSIAGIGDTGCGLVLDNVVLHNNAFGISKQNGTLTITRSQIRTNASGGIILAVNGTRFTIVGNVFTGNGGNTASGAIALQTDTSTTSRLDFNSFNGNLCNGLGCAIQCNVGGFVGRSNVMFKNGTNDQVSGTCTHVYSLAMPGTPLVGTGNIAVDPMFANEGIGDLHTLPGSPTENTGDPAENLTGIAAFDLDGDPRTAPADMGADQHARP